MNIAELMVRVTASTSDVSPKMLAVERSLNRVGQSSARLDGTMRAAHLQTGKLSSGFASLATQITGVHPIVGRLATVLGSFAVGGAVTAGVLLGITAIIGGYQKLTEGTRNAKEESDKLGKSLLDQANALHAASIAGRQEAYNKATDRLAAVKGDTVMGVGSTLLSIATFGLKNGGAEAAHAQAIKDALKEQQQAANNLGEAIAHLNNSGTATAVVHAKAAGEVTGKYNELRNAAERVNAEILKEKTDWWKGYIDRTNEALTITQQLANAQMSVRPSVLEALQSLAPTIPEFSMPKIGLDDGVTKEQKKQLEAMGIFTDDSNKNAIDIQSAIWGSATQLANSIVSSLNIGGGGKGSGIGGAVGGTAGFAIGSIVGGPIGGAIGATIGNMMGSAIGGTFDSTKAVNANTQATERNTAMMGALLNAPSGFKVALARYNATDVGALGRDVRRYMSRGGANPLSVGT